MGILKGIVSRRDIRESNETETSRDSGGAVKRDGGVQNVTVFGEMVFESVFSGFARNATYEELGFIRIHFEIHGTVDETLNPQINWKPLLCS